MSRPNPPPPPFLQDAISRLEVVDVKGPKGAPYIGFVFHFASGRRPITGAMSPAGVRELAKKLNERAAAAELLAQAAPAITGKA